MLLTSLFESLLEMYFLLYSEAYSQLNNLFIIKREDDKFGWMWTKPDVTHCNAHVLLSVSSELIEEKNNESNQGLPRDKSKPVISVFETRFCVLNSLKNLCPETAASLIVISSTV
jgi:hypothetical protein